MKTLDFEWKILEWFDRFESDFLNRCNQYISLILGSIGLIVILMIVYWTLNKEKGLIIAYNLFLAMLVNNLLKGLIMRKRPFENAGYEHLRKLDVAKDGATGSSFPSGHAMNSASLYTGLCCNFKSKRYLWIQIVSIIAMILVAIIRVYLGVHFPTDVVCGLTFGVVIALIFTFIQAELGSKKYFLYIFTIFAFMPCLFFKAYERDFYKSYGLLIGFVLATILEERFVKFDTNVKPIQKVIRVVIGMLVIGCEYLIYEIVPTAIHNNYYFAMGMHFVISFSGFFLVPLIFKMLEGRKKIIVNNIFNF